MVNLSSGVAGLWALRGRSVTGARGAVGAGGAIEVGAHGLRQRYRVGEPGEYALSPPGSRVHMRFHPGMPS